MLILYVNISDSGFSSVSSKSQLIRKEDYRTFSRKQTRVIRFSKDFFVNNQIMIETVIRTTYIFFFLHNTIIFDLFQIILMAYERIWDFGYIWAKRKMDWFYNEVFFFFNTIIIENIQFTSYDFIITIDARVNVNVCAKGVHYGRVACI